jgi:hypothetical protein
MNLADLILFLFASAGLTFIIVHATIMDKLGLRQFLNTFSFTRDLIKCSLCTGFWASLIISVLFFRNFNPSLPFAGSAFSFLFERLTILLDEKIIQIEKSKKTD